MLEVKLTEDISRFEGELGAICAEKVKLVEQLNKLEGQESGIRPLYDYARGLLQSVAQAAAVKTSRKGAAVDPDPK